MSTQIIRFPAQPGDDVRLARKMQRAFAKRGMRFDLSTVLAEMRASKGERLSEEGEAIARGIAHRLGIKLKPKA